MIHSYGRQSSTDTFMFEVRGNNRSVIVSNATVTKEAARLFRAENKGMSHVRRLISPPRTAQTHRWLDYSRSGLSITGRLPKLQADWARVTSYIELPSHCNYHIRALRPSRLVRLRASVTYATLTCSELNMLRKTSKHNNSSLPLKLDIWSRYMGRVAGIFRSPGPIGNCSWRLGNFYYYPWRLNYHFMNQMSISMCLGCHI